MCQYCSPSTDLNGYSYSHTMASTDGRTSPCTLCDYFDVQVPKGFMYVFVANLCNTINFFKHAVLYVVLVNPFGMGSNYFLIKGYHATIL